MTQSQIIKRIEQLERDLKTVQQNLAKSSTYESTKTAEDFFGMFHNDADFKKAMELGAAYRRSLRPRNSRARRAQEMILLDTDHISLLQWAGDHGDRIRARLRLLGLAARPPTSIITYEEQIRGWMGRLASAKTISDEISLYAKLKAQRDFASILFIMDFTAAAATVFQQMRRQKIRVGTMDLKIAAIALSENVTLWTRNQIDFGKVPGLRIFDATL